MAYWRLVVVVGVILFPDIGYGTRWVDEYDDEDWVYSHYYSGVGSGRFFKTVVTLALSVAAYVYLISAFDSWRERLAAGEPAPKPDGILEVVLRLIGYSFVAILLAFPFVLAARFMFSVGLAPGYLPWLIVPGLFVFAVLNHTGGRRERTASQQPDSVADGSSGSSNRVLPLSGTTTTLVAVLALLAVVVILNSGTESTDNDHTMFLEFEEAPASVAPSATVSPSSPAPGEVRVASAAEVTNVQAALKWLNYYTAAEDGVLGPKTALAIQLYERDTGMPETGRISPGLFENLDNTIRQVRAGIDVRGIRCVTKPVMRDIDYRACGLSPLQ